MKAWRVAALVGATLLLAVGVLALRVGVGAALPFFAIGTAVLLLGVLPLDRAAGRPGARYRCGTCMAPLAMEEPSGRCQQCGTPWQRPKG